jgi:hypothetical protein
MKHIEQPKTLGSEAGNLVTELHERRKTIFSYTDVADITGLNSKAARNLVGPMVERRVDYPTKTGPLHIGPL